MTYPIRVAILLCLSVFLTNTSKAQKVNHNNDLNKVHFTTKDGLAQNDPQAILQDSYGFIWIATNDGLSRYDGNSFKNFHIGDASLQSSLILGMLEDENSNIWVGTSDKGLLLFNRSENRFYSYRSLMDGGVDKNDAKVRSVRDIVRNDDNELYGYDTRLQKLFKFNLKSDLTHIDSIEEHEIDCNNNNQIRDIESIEHEIFILKGVNLYRGIDNKYQKIFTRDNVAAIKALPSQKLCIASYNNLNIYNPKTDKIESSIPINFNSNFIEYSNGYIWILSPDGLFRASYNRYDSTIGNLETIDTYQNGTTTKALTIDQQGGVWCGILHNGVLRYSENIRPFNSIETLAKSCVLSISQGNNGRLLVSTMSDPSGSLILEFERSGKDNFKVVNKIKSEDAINSIIQSPYDNKYYFSVNEQGIFTFENQKQREIIDTPLSLFVTPIDHFLWVGTYNYGLLRYNLQNGELTTITKENSSLPSNIVRNIIQDKQGDLWVATGFGLAKIEKDQISAKAPKLVKILADSITNHILALKEGYGSEMWVGTLGNGLYRLDKQPGNNNYSQNRYSTDNGLTNNAIKAIEQDEYGMIWLSSNRGLCRLDPTEGSVLTYDVMDGIQDLEFSELASLEIKDGTIFFGGVNGINYFNINNFKTDQSLSIPVLTDIQFFGHSVSQSDEYREYVASSVEMVENLDLPHDINSFTFKFTGINYTNPRKNSCQYKLEGFDKDWFTASDSKERAVYTNIAPGNYTFRVRSSNSDGIWNENELQIVVNINPPAWATWWAYIIYLLLLTGFVIFLINYLKYRLRRQNDHALAKLERAKIADMLEMRTRFFTNISHEFRTPLTLILSSLQQFKDDPNNVSNPRSEKYLNVMSHNGNMLMRQVNDLLEFAKENFAASTLELKNINFNAFARSNFEQFRFWAEQKGVSLVFNQSPDDLIIRSDINSLEHIIYNLCSNAIKHTPMGKEVIFNIEKVDNKLRFAVIDSGLGMSEDTQQRIFERFYSRADGASKDFSGTGIGLPLTKEFIEKLGGTITVESKENKGSSFIVTIPIIEPKSALEVVESLENYDTYIESNNSQESHEVESTEPITNKKRNILVVDDNEQITIMLSDLLSPRYNISVAHDGLEALKSIENNMPDILISDIMMPNMDGLQLCKAIKENNDTSHIPVVLLSAKGTNEDVVAGYNVDADAYCHKPFNNKVLKEILKSILHNRTRLSRRFKEMDIPNGEEITKPEDLITSNDRQLLNKITKFVEENLHDQDLMVNDICSHVGMTSAILNKKLKSLIGVTANAFIRSLRMKRAASLLRTGRYSISEITYDVGFVDLRYFRECFKKEFGMLPQEYKDQNREDEVEQSTTIEE